MPAQDLSAPIPDGTIVELLNSGFTRAKVVEYRGPLGPDGARIYRVLVRRKPPLYTEVREDQIRMLNQN